jgi:hypothetical protein
MTRVKGWQRKFDDPIELPDGGELRTLGEARHYIGFLPKAKQQRPEWQTAAKMLLMAADQGAPVMFVEIAMRSALSADGEPVQPPPRRKRAKRYKGDLTLLPILPPKRT